MVVSCKCYTAVFYINKSSSIRTTNKLYQMKSHSYMSFMILIVISIFILRLPFLKLHIHCNVFLLPSLLVCNFIEVSISRGEGEADLSYYKPHEYE